MVYSSTISVSGLVNDIVRGTVSENDAVVTVNGLAATVSNRFYLAENIPLNEGQNTLNVVATDAVGNEATASITVNYQPQRERQINLISGQAQTTVIQQSVSDPLVVQLLEEGEPVIDKPVVFRVIQGDGLLQPGTVSEGHGAVVQTNEQGQAQVNFKLGSRAGNGNHKVRARAVGFEGEVVFHASAAYGAGIQMGIIEGNNQRGSVRQPLPKPLVLAVTDAGANLIPNAQIEFEVIKGGGTFNNGETTYLTTTDTDGRANASFILGPEEGLDVQRVAATLVGTRTTAGFTSSGFVPGDPGQTAISGVVLDNQDQPMPGVTIRVDGSARQAVADEQGQFTITEAPVGPVHLLVEGSTTTRSGEWPSLSYNIVTVPGVSNPLASPIYLVEIDINNAVFVGEEDTIVTHPEIPGFKLEVPAGSVTFPDGSKSGYLSITRVNANKIPMPPPNGMQPQLIVTIQPHGAMFDPPAKLTIPNTDGHAPGAQIEMYSYDHDLEEFVTIGLGTVSADGSTITSDDGSGVIKAGWHCGSQPGGSGCCQGGGGGGGNCPDCQRSASGNCNSSDCEPVPDSKMGECKECRGGNLVNLSGPIEDQDCKVCENGLATSAEEGVECDDGRFCTSYDGYDPGPDRCEGGSCNGEDIKREKQTEVRTEAKKPEKLIQAAQYVLGNIAGVPYVDLSDFIGELRTVSYSEITVRECCEKTATDPGYIDVVNGVQAAVNLIDPSAKEFVDVRIPINPVINSLIDPRFFIEGEVKGRGILEDIETACEENCGLSANFVANAKVLAGLKARFISESVIDAKGGLTLEGSLGAKLNCEGLNGFGCLGPLGGEVTVRLFTGLSRRWAGKIPRTIKCSGDGGTTSD